MTFANSVNASNKDFAEDSGKMVRANRTKAQGIHYENLGMSLSAGTLTIHGFDGTALSSSNPATIVMPSKSSIGQTVIYEVTANQSFTDASGTSDITNNLFGTDSGRAWDPSGGMPFYIYAVCNDNEDTIQFMIARIPHAKVSPAAASIGAPDDAVADGDTDFWSLSNINEALFDGNPCISIGSFRMSKNLSDDWTIESLATNNASQDGIGYFNEQSAFIFQTNQNGAASGTHLRDNGGTAPTFSFNPYNYQIKRTGLVSLSITMTGNTATDGSGAVLTQVTTPLSISNAFSTNPEKLGMVATDSSVDGIIHKIASGPSTSNPYFTMSSAISNMQNSDFGDAQRAIVAKLNYRANTP